MRKKISVPSKFLIVKRHEVSTYDIIERDIKDGVIVTVAEGFATVKKAMMWIWDHDMERSQAEANRISQEK